MKIKSIASALGLVAAATLLVADGAYARRSGGDHDGGAAQRGDFHGSAKPVGRHASGTRWVGARFYRGTYDRDWSYYGGWVWGGAADVAAKAAARGAYDARNYDFLHRCYEPQRIWNGAYYAWQLVSVC